MASRHMGLGAPQYWLLMALGALALALVAFNIVTALGNGSLRAEVRERQAYINQSIQLGRFNNQLVQGLAQLSAQTGDDELKAVLNKHGVDFTVRQRDAETAAGGDAGGEQ